MRKKNGVIVLVLPLLILFSPVSHAWWLVSYKYWLNALLSLSLVFSGYNAQLLSEEARVPSRNYPTVIASTQDGFASIRADAGDYSHIAQHEDSGSLDNQYITLCFRHPSCYEPEWIDNFTQSLYATYPGSDCELPDGFFTSVDHVTDLSGGGIITNGTMGRGSPENMHRCYRVPYNVSLRYVEQHNKVLAQRKKQNKPMTFHSFVDKETYNEIHHERIKRGGMEGADCDNRDFKAVNQYQAKQKAKFRKKKAIELY